MAEAKTGPAGWAFSKRVLHWAIALAVLVAVIAPKPDDGAGTIHIAAGSLAAAMVVVRLFWRLVSDVRPRFRDSFKVSIPSFDKLGPRAFAMPAAQIGRLIGFAFLALIPATVAFGVFGIEAGEDSPLLEVHEAAGTAIVILAIAHALLALIIAALGRFESIGMTLWRSGPLNEGGARGIVGLFGGAAIAAAALFYLWGPYDIANRAANFEDRGSESYEAGERGEDDDD